MMPARRFDVAVVGAAGMVGRRITAALVDAGLHVTALVRGAGPPDVELPNVHRVDGADADALARGIAGARVVVNAAGPLRDTAERVLAAAIAAKASYLDVGGEQAVLRTLFERHESAVRHAGLVAIPGCGFDGMLGDLLACHAAQQLEPTLEDPLDEVAISYVFEELALSAGSQRTLFGSAFSRPLVWRRDRWEPARTADHRRVDAGPGFGGAREAIAYAGGSPITLPRHLPARLVATYAATTRKRSGVMRLLATALPLVPRVQTLLTAYASPDTDYARTQYAIVVELRRRYELAHATLRGHDMYATTAAITAWCAIELADHGTPRVGIRAPCEVFAPAAALAILAADLDLELEPPV